MGQTTWSPYLRVPSMTRSSSTPPQAVSLSTHHPNPTLSGTLGLSSTIVLIWQQPFPQISAKKPPSPLSLCTNLRVAYWNVPTEH